MLSKSFYFKLLSIILIAGVGIIAYSNTFHCSFHYDDNPSIVDNFHIRNLYALQSIWDFLPRRCILYFSLALNYHFGQINVWGYHLVNLGVHLITAILIWWLVQLTLLTAVMKNDKIAKDANLIALLTGLVFVSHPVQTEAVTYIVQRAASMATLFYVASLCFYIKFRSGQACLATTRIYHIYTWLTAILAMMTKETAITLPFMILLYEFYFLKTAEEFNWRKTLPFLLTLFIIPFIMFFTETQASRLQELRLEPEISPFHYLLTQFNVLITYLQLIFFPLHQNIDYDYPVSTSFFQWPTWMSFLILLTILYTAKRLFTKHRLISFSILWFFLTLLPESSIFPIKDIIFEHRLYLPLVGFSLFLVSSVYFLLEKKPRYLITIILAIIISCNTITTYERNKVWEDDFTLWNDALLHSPHKARVFNNRGKAYFEAGQIFLALKDYNAALAIDPDYADAYYNRGVLYNSQNHFPQAMTNYNQAITIRPEYAAAYVNRGNIYSQEGNPAQAISDYNQAIKLNPHLAEGYYNKAVCYFNLKKYAMALSNLQQAIQLGMTVNPAFIKAIATNAAQK